MRVSEIRVNQIRVNQGLGVIDNSIQKSCINGGIENSIFNGPYTILRFDRAYEQ